MSGNYLNISTICRVCLNEKQSMMLFNNYNQNASENPVEILRKCVNLEYLPNIYLPQQICSVCISKAKDYLEFKKLCLRTEKMFELYVHQSPTSLRNKRSNSVYKENDKKCVADEIKSEPNESQSSEDNDNADYHEDEYNSNGPTEVTKNDDDDLELDENTEVIKTDNDDLELDENTKYQISSTVDGMKEEITKIYKYFAKNTPKPTEIQKCFPSKRDNDKYMFYNLDMLKPYLDATSQANGTDSNEIDTEKQNKALPPKRSTVVVCDSCSRRFASQRDLNQHIRKTHGKKKVYQCKICEKVFKHSQNMVTHIRVHTGERPYKCSQCDRCFTHPTEVKSHEISHSDFRKYVCELCGNSYKRLAILKKHMYVHTGILDFPCQKCDKKFPTNHKLKNHMYSHLDTKTFKCGICFKFYKSPRVLYFHQQIHKGIKPHMCPHCGRCFLQKHVMKGHVRAMHEGDRPDEFIPFTDLGKQEDDEDSTLFMI